MKFLLDLSGHDDDGRPGIDRLGGLFSTIEDAETYGERAAKTGRFAFAPATLWVRDEENQVVRQTTLSSHR